MVTGESDAKLINHAIAAGVNQFLVESFTQALLQSKVVENFRTEAQSRNVKIQFDYPEICIAMAEKLLSYSMLGNLIKNAVEATPENGKGIVTLERNERCHICINNPGVIPLELKHNLFNKHATFSKKGGTGLGTYSAKLMATVQLGDIEVESDNVKGTTFRISLPKA